MERIYGPKDIGYAEIKKYSEDLTLKDSKIVKVSWNIHNEGTITFYP